MKWTINKNKHDRIKGTTCVNIEKWENMFGDERNNTFAMQTKKKIGYSEKNPNSVKLENK